MNMHPEFKAKFLEALRSGRYKQTRGALRRGDSYCCLGVACEVMREMGLTDREWDLITHSPDEEFCFDLSSAYLSKDLRAAINLSGEDHERLYEMNDDLLYTFADIADHIEGLIP